MSELNSAPTTNSISSPSTSQSVSQPAVDTTASSPTNQASPEAPGQSSSSSVTKTFKVKVDGSEREVDEATMIRNYQLAEASNKRFQDAAKKEKQIQAQIEKLKSDPWAAMKEFGMDPREAAEAYLAAQLEEEMMDPRDRELRDLKKENSQFKQTESEKKKQADQMRMQEMTAKAQESLQQEFIGAIQATGLKPSYATVRRMAALMHDAGANGVDLTADQAAQIISEELSGDVSDHLSAYDDAESLAQLLGPERLKKLREWELSKLKNPAPSQVAHTEVKSTNENNKKYKSSDDFFADARKKLGI